MEGEQLPAPMEQLPALLEPMDDDLILVTLKLIAFDLMKRRLRHPELLNQLRMPTAVEAGLLLIRAPVLYPSVAPRIPVDLEGWLDLIVDVMGAQAEAARVIAGLATPAARVEYGNYRDMIETTLEEYCMEIRLIMLEVLGVDHHLPDIAAKIAAGLHEADEFSIRLVAEFRANNPVFREYNQFYYTRISMFDAGFVVPAESFTGNTLEDLRELMRLRPPVVHPAYTMYSNLRNENLVLFEMDRLIALTLMQVG